MADFDGLRMELESLGTKINYEVRHNGEVLSYLFGDVFDTKETMDSIVQSYLTNFTISSTLEDNSYKGDAVLQI